MNVKQLRAFLDREESLWPRDMHSSFEDEEVVIDTFERYNDLEAWWCPEVGVIFYPVADAKVETHVPLSPTGCPAWGEMEDL